MRQLSYLPKSSRLPPQHGGSLRPGRRKTMRAVDCRQLMHVVLRASRAKDAWSLLHARNRPHVDQAARGIADRHGVRLYHYANVGNHVHLLVKARNRTAFKNFLRDVTGAIAIIVTGAQKGRALLGGRFWDFIPYTRIVSWGRDYANLKLYFIKNLFEAAGLLSRGAKAQGLRPIPIEGWARGP